MQMADENRPLKYMRYAIGEILLVVVGILIALQINTWNQGRLAKIEEKIILKNLHNEFIQNKTILDSCISSNKKSLSCSNALMAYIGMEEELLSTKNLDSLLFYSFEIRSYIPSENAINDLIQSGRLQLLGNDNLKKLLHTWSSNIELVRENFEGIDKKVEEEIIPYLTTRYPLKDMDSYGPLNGKKLSVLKIDKHKIYNIKI